MRRSLKVGAIAALLVAIGFTVFMMPSSSERKLADESKTTPEGRWAFEFERLKSPITGEIPNNIRNRELALAMQLKSARSNDSNLVELAIEHVGPYNVGGRTRAVAIDRSNPNIYFAGGVSGGMWKSEDAGESWTRVTAPEDHAAVSCISQDPRTGKENIWYYGSGEVSGNSASKSFSAWYRGSGIYKSLDGGDTWTLLPSTAALAHKASDWDAVFRVMVDPTRNDSDIVYAATGEGIMRSNDGGTSWSPTLHSTIGADFTDFDISTDGVIYAAISSDGGGSVRGLWRSEDGVIWTNITPNSFPENHDRTLIKIYPGDENKVYFLSTTPGAGTLNNSLWKYEYLSGDGTGTGGSWSNRSSGLPHRNLNLYNGYCQALAVKPDDEDVVFVGGTNLYRSTNGFTDTLSTHHIGGYAIEWDTTFTYRTGRHYPDQQNMVFHPNNPDVMISTSDGGIFRTSACADYGFEWQPLNNGYVVSQFYGIGIDRGTPGSEQIMGGLQDRGTFWTDAAHPDSLWVSVRGADGAYVWIEDGGNTHYSSTQYANVRKAYIDEDGHLEDWIRLIPESWPSGSGSGFLFVHPFTLDPVDQNIMYLPNSNTVWRNDNLAAADNEDLTHWQQITSLTGTITSIAASESEQGTVYIGTSNTRIYKLEDAHTSAFVTPELISDNGILNGGYTSCISIDPNDADRVIVVYSNYSTASIWLTEDGGDSWEPIEGNLRGTPDANVPPNLYFISDGPSIRWAEFAPTEDGYVYFLGTSIGLFSTTELNGDSTHWHMEGENSIGNVVVDMLDYRASDQWLVVGTHGNGIYAADVSIRDTATGIKDVRRMEPAFNLHPNPASEEVWLSPIQQTSSEWSAELMDAHGRVIQRHRGRGTQMVDIRHLNSGNYFFRFNQSGRSSYRSLIKQ